MVHSRSLPAFSPLDQGSGSHYDPKGHFLPLLQLYMVTQLTGRGRATSNTHEKRCSGHPIPEELVLHPISASLLVLSPKVTTPFCKLGTEHMTCFYCPKPRQRPQTRGTSVQALAVPHPMPSTQLPLSRLASSEWQENQGGRVGQVTFHNAGEGGRMSGHKGLELLIQAADGGVHILP